MSFPHIPIYYPPADFQPDEDSCNCDAEEAAAQIGEFEITVNNGRLYLTIDGTTKSVLLSKFLESIAHSALGGLKPELPVGQEHYHLSKEQWDKLNALASTIALRGWTAELETVAEDGKLYARFLKWTGGDGSPPEPPVPGYWGPGGWVAKAQAANFRGVAGEKGEPGKDGEKGLKGDIGLQGNSGWTALYRHEEVLGKLALRFHQWIGGTGNPPAPPALPYMGESGAFVSETDAKDTRGPAGANGEPGPQGPRGYGYQIDERGLLVDRDTYDSEPADFTYMDEETGFVYFKRTENLGDWSEPYPFLGFKGWSPNFANVSDGERIVQQVISWHGGQGTAPTLSYYLGELGPVNDISSAKDIRGPVGPKGDTGVGEKGDKGDPGQKGATGEAGPATFLYFGYCVNPTAPDPGFSVTRDKSRPFMAWFSSSTVYSPVALTFNLFSDWVKYIGGGGITSLTLDDNKAVSDSNFHTMTALYAAFETLEGFFDIRLFSGQGLQPNTEYDFKDRARICGNKNYFNWGNFGTGPLSYPVVRNVYSYELINFQWVCVDFVRGHECNFQAIQLPEDGNLTLVLKRCYGLIDVEASRLAANTPANITVETVDAGSVQIDPYYMQLPIGSQYIIYYDSTTLFQFNGLAQTTGSKFLQQYESFTDHPVVSLSVIPLDEFEVSVDAPDVQYNNLSTYWGNVTNLDQAIRMLAPRNQDYRRFYSGITYTMGEEEFRVAGRRFAFTRDSETQTLELPLASAILMKPAVYFFSDETGTASVGNPKIVKVQNGSPHLIYRGGSAAGVTEIRLTQPYEWIIISSDWTSKWLVMGGSTAVNLSAYTQNDGGDNTLVFRNNDNSWWGAAEMMARTAFNFLGAKFKSLAAVAFSGAYNDLTGRPTLGTAASRNVPATGNAAAAEVVLGADGRMTDPRTPNGTASGHLSGNYPNPSIRSDGSIESNRPIVADMIRDINILTRHIALKSIGFPQMRDFNPDTVLGRQNAGVGQAEEVTMTSIFRASPPVGSFGTDGMLVAEGARSQMAADGTYLYVWELSNMVARYRKEGLYRRNISAVAYTAVYTDFGATLALVSTTAAQTVTLPLSATIIGADVINIGDESGQATAFTKTIVCQGTDTIWLPGASSGVASVTLSNYQNFTLSSNEAGKYFVK